MPLKPTTIPEKELSKRWDFLPMPLREEMVSERNSEILWKICEGEHLSEEKTEQVARLAGWVMMGFLHPEDVANEVKLATGIHPEIASRISQSLSAKIFAPIREDLDAIYAPPGTDPKIASAAPVLVEEIRHPEKTAETLEKLKPQSGAPFFTETPVSLDSLPSASPEAELPLPPLGDVPPEPSAPPPLPPLSPETPSSPAQTPNLKPDASDNAAPFMIHEEAEAPELPRLENFSLNITPEEFGPSVPEMKAIPQANIEIGGETEGEKVKSAKTEDREARIVHYGEFRTPLEPTIPETPFSSFIEPSKEPEPARGEPAESAEGPAPDMSAPIDFGGFGGMGGPETPPSSELAPPAPVPVPKKQGFFARLFRRKNKPDPISGAAGDLPTTPEIPHAPEINEIPIPPALQNANGDIPPPPK